MPSVHFFILGVSVLLIVIASASDYKRVNLFYLGIAAFILSFIF